MKSHIAALTVLAVLGIICNFALGNWDRIAPISPYETYAGSALCAGIATEIDGRTRACVWFLENGSGDRFYRIDIVTGETAYTSNIPLLPITEDGAGSSLAYVPDRYAVPSNGWVFGFKGQDTREFWVFDPGLSSWFRAPDVPEPVTEGGGLCYGGVEEIDGVPHEVLYAFTGQYHQDQSGNYWGHFWRYAFDNMPTKGDFVPVNGTWKRLPDLPAGRMDRILPRLTWVPMSNQSPSYPRGMVVVMRNNLDRPPRGYFVRFLPDRNGWEDRGHNLPNEEDRLTPGASITAFGPDSVMFLLGDDYPTLYGFYNPVSGRVRYLYHTPEIVQAGAALTSMIGRLEAYGVFKEGGPGRWVWRYYLPAEQEGEQGKLGGLSAQLRAVSGFGGNGLKLSVSGVAGRVELVITDVAGRVIERFSQQSGGGTAEFVLPLTGLARGVYLWRIENGGYSVAGKFINHG